MNQQNREEFRKLLRDAIAPVEEAGLRQDLWPRMLQRLDRRPARASWLDCALAALTLAWLLLFPEVIAGLLFQL
jgi:hypothetical protein